MKVLKSYTYIRFTYIVTQGIHIFSHHSMLDDNGYITA